MKSGRGLLHSKTLARRFKTQEHSEAFGLRQSSAAFAAKWNLLAHRTGRCMRKVPWSALEVYVEKKFVGEANPRYL